MFLLRILQLITGYVRFKAYGGFGERFINLCSQNEINLWDVETNGETIYASTSIEGYRKIRPCAKRSGMTTRLIKKKGIPFFIFRHRKRIGIPIGILFFIISISLLSTRIWLINVEGNSTIPNETILTAFEKSGLYVGCSKLSSDPVMISNLAENKIDGISEVSVNIHGSRATIKVKERGETPDIIDYTGTYDIVSSKDAQLVILEPYRGTTVAKKLNSVLKGEVLISGIVENKDLSTSYVHASGYAVGRTEETIKAEVLQNENFKKIKSQKKIYSIYFLGIEIPLGKAPKKFDFVFKKEKYLSYSGKQMPIGFFVTEYSSISNNKAKLNQAQQSAICIERFMNSAKEYSDTRQIISEKDMVNFKSKDKNIIGKFVCFENIGIERKFTINESSPLE